MRYIVLIISFVLGVNVIAQNTLNPYSAYPINYSDRFTIEVRSQYVESRDNNLRPMLDVGTMVPNGGIFRFVSQNQTWRSSFSKPFVSVFEDAAYTENNPLFYYRFDWYRLESIENEYQFDEVIEPLMIDAYKKHARVVFGLACNCGSSSVAQKINGKAVAVPLYLFDEIQKSDHPMFEDEQFGAAYVPDYDSPILLERHRELLKAFAVWIEKPLNGSTIKRKDLIFGIETRYFGYWGEGATRDLYYPKTDLFNQYLDSYNDCFPDILLIGSIQHSVHLPKESSYNSNPKFGRFVLSMQHCSKMLNMQNRKGHWGYFIDSWQYNSDQYDLCSNRVLYDEDGQATSLALFLRDNIYGSCYLTGEFDFFGKTGDEPYGGLYQQFTTRGLSGISINGVRAAINGVRMTSIPDSVYTNIRECLSMAGYRLVLNPNVKITKRWLRNYVTINLTNIGVSSVFSDYYKMRFFVKDSSGKIVYDTFSDFDLRKVAAHSERPLLYNMSDGINLTQYVGRKRGKLYLKIIDIKGIELPMTLSNYGRLSDGSYYLGELK